MKVISCNLRAGGLSVLVSHRRDVLGSHFASMAITGLHTHPFPESSRGEADLEWEEAREERKRRHWQSFQWCLNL